MTLSLSFLFPTAACAFRYNGLSFVYLIYLLLIPLFSEPTKATMQGKRRVLFSAEVGMHFAGLPGLSLSDTRDAVCASCWSRWERASSV